MKHFRRPALLVSAALATGGLLIGCSGDGRDLQPARPDQTQSILDPTTVPSTTAPSLFPVISLTP
jgi:hypothetical protein